MGGEGMSQMHAVFITGSKQYRVSEGDTLQVEADTEEGSDIDFDTVLMLSDGDDVKVGAPYVDGGKVSATVTAHGKGDEVSIIKFKRHKGCPPQR